MELKDLRASSTQDATVTLQNLFWLWTVKEAYTKTLGLGLGFNFSRITFDVHNDVIYVDEAPLCGFQFVLFELDLDGQLGGGVGVGRYQGVAVRRIGGDGNDVGGGVRNVPSTIVRRSVMFKEPREQQTQQDWIKFWNASDLVERSDILAT